MTISLATVTDLRTLLELDPVKPDAFLGAGPDLGWGRIYGGQVVAQALRAATLTVEREHRPHSLHAYFVRAGDERQPVLYEVERVRDGRSFTTRQVVAYQAGGAILNLIASFQVDEEGEDVQSIRPPGDVPPPEELPPQTTDLFFEHRIVGYERRPEAHAITWMRVVEDLGDDPTLHACALAYLSDEHPLGVAILPHSLGGQWDRLMSASLDHALWFHRPVRTDQWLLFDLAGHGVANARGLAVARVFTADGVHVASVAQEGLVRPRRSVSAGD
ncbi:MAG: acyl-CoA thioesterase II [Acidimicrobiales bacterium]|nr:acyl-CoA thioesterase II [Acidimicrobiales bacterium]